MITGIGKNIIKETKDVPRGRGEDIKIFIGVVWTDDKIDVRDAVLGNIEVLDL